MLLAEVPTLDDVDVVVRLAVAAGLGAAVGFERELRDREAGMVERYPTTLLAFWPEV